MKTSFHLRQYVFFQMKSVILDTMRSILMFDLKIMTTRITTVISLMTLKKFSLFGSSVMISNRLHHEYFLVKDSRKNPNDVNYNRNHINDYQ